MSFTIENHVANLIMDNFALAYIASRMKQMGFDTYSFEPYVAVLDNDKLEFDIQGQNEYYYLISKELTYGMEIQGDNNFLPVWDYHSYQELLGVHEFTGHIHISIYANSGQQVFEFIRVIPKYN
jgi:hypothetical protein